MEPIGHVLLTISARYGCLLLSRDEVELDAFMIAFLGVFFAGQASSSLFQFSTSKQQSV